MRLFAYIRKVLKIVYDKNNDKQLQCDLNTLQQWSENWQLCFNFDKCEVLCISHARDLASYPFKLSIYMLQSVTKNG